MPRAQIIEVQYLRAFAVLLVLIGHINQAEMRVIDGDLLGSVGFFGFSGVDVFFVISGFIIHTLYRDHSGLDWRFFLNRLNRIYPMYWLVTLVGIAGYTLLLGRPLEEMGGNTNWLTTVTLFPTEQLPLLAIGWTLTHELYFYLVYGLFLALPMQWRPWALGGWLAVSLFGLSGLGGALPAAVELVISPFNLLFLSGIALAQFRPRFERWRWASLLPLLGGLALGGWWTQTHGLLGLANDSVRVLVFMPFAFGLCWALLAFKPVLPQLFARIGDWSYVLYLGHPLVIVAFELRFVRVFEAWPLAHLIFYAGCIFASLVAAWIAHRLAERPALALGKSLIARTGSSRAAQGGA